MTPPSDTTRQRILDSARAIFQRKGLAGARMQEIADDVGINKAMIHYYFETKEKLFEAVFDDAVAILTGVVTRILDADLSLAEKIPKFVSEYLDVLSSNPHIPVFVLGELNRDPERLGRLARSLDLEGFARQVMTEARAGKIRPTDPRRLLVDMMSLCVFPFAARPVFQGAFGLTDQGFRKLIEARKREIPELLLGSIEP